LLLTLAFALAGWAIPVAAQNTGVITGRVSDEGTGQPIGAVQLSIPGLNLGTVSRADGRYSIANVPAGTHEVRAELIGFAAVTRTVSVSAGQTATLHFTLSEQAVSMDEIVVTGTAGAARRREVGNSVGSIGAGTIQLKAVRDVSQVLQGEVTGLTQFTTEGQVGAGTAIRIRGNSSLTQGNAPIIYIDGVRMTSAENPGANGSQQMASPLDNLNPDDIERVEVIRGAAATTLYGTEANGGVIQIFTKRGGGDRAVWTMEGSLGTRYLSGNSLGPVVGEHETYLSLKPWLKNGTSSDLSTSVRGSALGVDYYLSGDYSYGAGVMETQDSRRAGFRTNLAFQAAAPLRVTVNSSYSTRRTNWLQSGDNASGVVLNLLRSPQNNTAGADSVLFDQETVSDDDHFIGGLTLAYTPSRALTSRLTVGLDWVDGFNEFTQPFGYLLFAQGRRQTNRWRHTTFTVDYAGTWNQDLTAALNSQFSWGFQLFNDYDHRQFGTAEGFPGPVDPTLTTGSLRTATEDILKNVNAGFFLQEQVGIQDRLFLTAGLRVDGNSAFGDDFGLQPYPKVSASYLISESEWWPEAIPTLKLRAAVGESGKAPGAFDAVRTWQPIAGYEGQPGITPENLGDQNLGPERTREIEVGFEGSALNERVSVDFNWYQATTRETLVPVQDPPSQGFSEPQLRNIGKIRNSGIEATLTVTPIRTQNLVWDLRGQISTNESEALDLGGAIIPIGFQSWRAFVREGFPVPAYWGIKVTNPDEIAAPVTEPDGFYGPMYPTHNYGFGTTLNLFRRLTLYALFEGAGGHYMLNGVARQNAIRGLWPECEEQKARGVENMAAIWRERCATNPGWETWTFPADYLKLRNLSATFNIPQGVIPGTTNASFTVGASNLFKWTDYPGLDPEITRGDIGLERREYYHLPPSTTVTASLRVNF
jgi:outer membrane receptor protein involved in Fe transport